MIVLIIERSLLLFSVVMYEVYFVHYFIRSIILLRALDCFLCS